MGSPGDGMISTRISVGDAVVTGRCATQPTTAPRTAAVRPTTAIVSRERRRAGATDASESEPGPRRCSSRTHCSCIARSRMLANRASGSFCRQVQTMRSRAGGMWAVPPAATASRRAGSRPAGRVNSGVERPFAGQHLVQRRAKREDVRPRVGDTSLDLLRGHVRQRAQHGCRFREGRRDRARQVPSACRCRLS